MSIEKAVFEPLFIVFPHLRSYYARVIQPVEDGAIDDGYLAAWVNDQIAQWRDEAAREGGRAGAAETATLLEIWLDEIRKRIRSRIAAAEAELGPPPMFMPVEANHAAD